MSHPHDTESTGPLAAALEASGEGLLVLDATGVRVANRRFFELWQVPPLLRGPGRAGLLEFVRAQAVGPLALGGEGDDVLGAPCAEQPAEVVLRDGRCFEQACHPWVVDGQRRGRVVAYRDVTAERATRRELALGEERFRTLFEQAAVGVAEIDTTTGRFVRINQKYSAIIGYSPDEMPSLDFMRITHPDDLSPDLALMQRLREGTLREFELEKRLLHRDGSTVWVHLTVSPMWAPGQRPTHHIAVVQDISSRVHAEQQRRGLEEQLRQAQKMEALGTLAGGIAHDFNNVLAIIVGNTEIIREDLRAGREVSEPLEAVFTAAARARDLVRQILAFSRRQPPRRVSLAVRGVVEEAAGLLRSTLPSGIDVVLELPADEPAVLGDPTHLHQVLMNLGTNAWHAIERGLGRITFGADTAALTAEAAERLGLAEGDYVRLRVVDTGVGMDRATLERIYEPFFTTKGVGRGSGLGLSVVHGLIEDHGGAITAESTPGQGTTFTVYLPRESTGLDATPTQRPATLRSRPGQGRVLFVDDEAPLVRATGRLLTHLGFMVATTTSPEEAIALVRRDPARFDLVITDFNMPGLSGLDVARAVRRCRADLPIVLVTGHADRSVAEMAEAGVTLRLDKPFGSADLAEVAWKALGRA